MTLYFFIGSLAFFPIFPTGAFCKILWTDVCSGGWEPRKKQGVQADQTFSKILGIYLSWSLQCPPKRIPSKSKASFYWALFSAKLTAKVDLQKLFVEMVESRTLLREERLLQRQLQEAKDVLDSVKGIFYLANG